MDKGKGIAMDEDFSTFFEGVEKFFPQPETQPFFSIHCNSMDNESSFSGHGFNSNPSSTQPVFTQNLLDSTQNLPAHFSIGNKPSGCGTFDSIPNSTPQIVCQDRLLNIENNLPYEIINSMSTTPPSIGLHLLQIPSLPPLGLKLSLNSIYALLTILNSSFRNGAKSSNWKGSTNRIPSSGRFGSGGLTSSRRGHAPSSMIPINQQQASPQVPQIPALQAPPAENGVAETYMPDQGYKDTSFNAGGDWTNRSSTVEENMDEPGMSCSQNGEEETKLALSGTEV